MKKAALLKKRLKGMLIVLCCIRYTCSQAQAVSQPDTIDVAKIRFSVFLKHAVLWYRDSTHAIRPEQLPGLAFKDIVTRPVALLPTAVQKDIYCRFVLRNSADTAISCYFFPGFYFREIILYVPDPTGHGVKRLQQLSGEHTGFKKIRLEAHQVTMLFTLLRSIKISNVTFRPELLHEDYYNAFTDHKKAEGKEGNVISFVFVGVMLMMIFYSIAVFTVNGSIEFLYYAGYATCIAVMLLIKEYSFRTPSNFVYFFEGYFDYILQFTGTFIYLSFLKTFISAKHRFPFLHKVFVTEQVLIVVSLSLFTYLYFETNSFVALNQVETNSKIFMLAGAVVFVGYTIYTKQRVLYYLAIGHSFLLFSSFLSLYLIQTPGGFGNRVYKVFNNALFYFELGLTVELMFFMIALASKNRRDIIERTQESERLQLQYERQDFEKQLAVYAAMQEERNRISADMHDELGSGVTAIRLMSEIVKSKMKENTLPEINRISSSANDLINKMNTIIWTMKSEHDTLQSLLTYIRTYALEFFENTPIDCSVNIPTYQSNPEISGEKRRNIFLSVKETLHNVLKHSKGSKVTVSFVIESNLVIAISDNGRGIDPLKLRTFGNGLGNIQKRMEIISGTYTIENNPDAGSKTILKIPL